MEKINTEILVSSLLLCGFDRVDPFLYTFVLGKLNIDNKNMKIFEFEDKELTETFKSYVNYDGVVFTLKEGIDLDTSIIHTKNHVWPLKNVLQTNRKLLEYLQQLDFIEIISKKLYNIGEYESISEEKFNYLFSNKEKQMINMLETKEGHIETKIKVKEIVN